jgi:hypothetical protein
MSSERSRVELGFCANLFAATSLETLEASLRECAHSFELTTQRRCGIGLWFPNSLARQLDRDESLRAGFYERLVAMGWDCFSFNAFPYGDFHSERVKESVFQPSWAEPARLAYTLRIGRIAASWAEAGELRSISSLALGLARLETAAQFREQCRYNLVELCASWALEYESTGIELVLGLEMEPGSVLEATPQLIEYFESEVFSQKSEEQLFARGISQPAAALRRHLGACFDLCHQALQYEDPVQSLSQLASAGIRIAKMQLTNALELRNPADAASRAELARYVEPRYLHQVTIQTSDLSVKLVDDLERLLPDGDGQWDDAECWRIHFHVPVHRATLGRLHTTQAWLEAALRFAVDRQLTSHFEVETYTWELLPDSAELSRPLASRIGDEMAWARERIVTGS